MRSWRILLVAGLAVAGLVVLLGLGLDLGLRWFLEAEQFGPRLEQQMSNALGRSVSIGKIRPALLSGGVIVDDLSIADDPAFSDAPFVTARSMAVRLDLRTLVLFRKLQPQSCRLEKPQLVLLRSATGSWNFSSLSKATQAVTGPGLSIQDITIASGRIVVSGRSGPRAYEDVTLEGRGVSDSGRFPIRLSAKTPSGGTVSLEGEVGPLDAADAARTPFRAAVRVNHLDVPSTGLVDPASGVAGRIDYSGTLASDGLLISSRGKVKASGLQLVPGGSPARVPFEVDYESEYDTRLQSGTVKRGEVHIGAAVAGLTGEFHTDAQAAAVQMTLSGDQMPLTEFEAAILAIGLTLPQGATLRQGTLDADFAITGPVDHMTIAGPIRVSNAIVAGFDLAARLGTMASFAGLARSNQTIIQTLGATLEVAPQGIQVDHLSVVVPAIGRLTGAGTVAPDGSMDFKMLARPTGSGATGAVTGGMVFITSLGKGVPFRIHGTTTNPDFGPDVGRAVGNVVKSPGTATKAAGGFLGGLFRSRKEK